MLKIKELRKNIGLSQLELAQKIDTTQSNIGRWENGENEPSYSYLVKLADFFECTIDYLVGREDDFGIVAVKSDLSEEEKELVSCFSKMDDIQKRAILMTARSFAKNKTEDLLSTK